MDGVTLTMRNRARLREIVRRTHMRFYPKDKVTTRELDQVIDALSPAIVEPLIKAWVDNKLGSAQSIEDAVEIARRGDR